MQTATALQRDHDRRNNTLPSHYQPKPGKSVVTDSVTNNDQWTMGQLLTSLLLSPPGSWAIFSIIEKWVILHSEVVIISNFNLTKKYLISVLIAWSIFSYKMWFCINVKIYFFALFLPVHGLLLLLSARPTDQCKIATAIIRRLARACGSRARDEATVLLVGRWLTAFFQRAQSGIV